MRLSVPTSISRWVIETASPVTVCVVVMVRVAMWCVNVASGIWLAPLARWGRAFGFWLAELVLLLFGCGGVCVRAVCGCVY